ncbi:MAG: DUF1566 domain-containing protein [Proteobacteria bacterium]|nr:DUF1566 domain-containing protein [Pseudomonadota bacterium]
MLIKHNRPDTWRPWRTILEMRGRQLTIGTTILLLLFALPRPPAHAIGPHTSGDKTVIDHGTGLEWQKTDSSTMHTWQNALAYCEDLSLDDKTDWRLPNIRELKSLVDYSRYYPAIDPSIPCKSSSYWSSTTAVATDSHSSAWIVFFGNGDDVWKLTTGKAYVRCVRTDFSGQ